MARLDVHPMSGDRAGYLLDVQSDLLAELKTRTVVPLLPLRALMKPITDLNPVFAIGGEAHVMVTQAIATIPTRQLGRVVASVPNEHDRVVRALDLLLVGL